MKTVLITVEETGKLYVSPPQKKRATRITQLVMSFGFLSEVFLKYA